jgi:starch-binding outer membrane protein SusE/F
MKHLIKSILAISMIAFTITSCDKAQDLVIASNGNAPTLSSSASFTPTAADSSTGKLNINWTDPKYANDPTTTRYELQIDSTGRNFTRATKRVVIGKLTEAIIAKDWNILLLDLGFKINVPGTVQVRLISSYGNFNERFTSNVISVAVNPYVVPPKVAIPTSGKLFLVGDASQGGWNNPVPVPTQEFAKLDNTTWAGVFNLVGNKQYLVLPVNGDWSNKFSVANNGSAPVTGGDFGFNLSDNFKGPTTSGWYTITLDFQAGKYYVTPWVGTLPTNLFIVGDATNGGWNNPVPAPAQQLNRLNSSEWTITLPIVGGKQYLLLPVNGSWDNKYAVNDNSIPGLSSGGEFGYNFGQNFPGPAASGTYTITTNFVTKKFKVTQ